MDQHIGQRGEVETKLVATACVSHHAISSWRQKPESARSTIRTFGHRLRICATIRATSSGLPALGDRKSTRLNSSHGYISYAVFCLKKKKITAVRSQVRVAAHEVSS